jgi:hypothetical protein
VKQNPIMSVVCGDLLAEGQADCIFQQCNCLAVRPHGLSASIATVFPYADVYSLRKAVGRRNLAQPEDRPLPGTCKLLAGSGPYVACLFGQYQYGRSGCFRFGDYEKHPDEPRDREEYFWQSLQDFHRQAEELRQQDGRQIHTLGFPFNIGCGLAGGRWPAYLSMIKKFATIHPEYQVLIFQINGDDDAQQKRKLNDEPTLAAKKSKQT